MSENQAKPTITLSGARGEEWERVLGTRTLPIQDPDPRVLSLESHGDAACVFLDVDGLALEQQDAMITHMARRSGCLRSAVRREVYTRGVPIRVGADTHVEVPAEYVKRRKLAAGPDVFDPRFF